MALPAGPEGTAKQFYRRHHAVVVSAVLSVTGLATGVAAALALMQALAFANVGLLGVSALVVLVAAYGLLRHWGLAILTAIAPLPGLIWAAPVASGSDFGVVPFLAYGLGVTAALLYGEHKLARLVQPDLAPCDASYRGAGPLLPVVASAGLIAVLALLWFHHGVLADAALQAVADSCLALLAVLLLPLGLSLLAFDEAFVARANRAREQRERWLEGLAFAAVPRWGLSLTGITVVLLVLGWYGARVAVQDALLLPAVSLLLLVLWGGVIGAGWREGVAFAAAIGTACLLTLWATGLATALSAGGVGVLQVVGFAALLALCGAWRARSYRQRHDTAGAARERVLADCGGLLSAVVASVGALLPGAVLYPGVVVTVAGVMVAGGAGVLLAPAVVTGLEAFFPRRAKVEELYSRRGAKR